MRGSPVSDLEVAADRQELATAVGTDVVATLAVEGGKSGLDNAPDGGALATLTVPGKG